jgi:hypothetical protein
MKGIIIKLLLLVFAIVLFLVTAIIALTGGAWDTFSHLFAIACFGLAAFAASFLPIPWWWLGYCSVAKKNHRG